MEILCNNYWFITKVIFQMFLLFIFLYFFGVPSLQRYMSGEVLSVTTETYTNKTFLPAVTVSAFNASASSSDWEGVCAQSDDLGACIREKTRSLPQTVHAELGFDLRESLEGYWREDFTPRSYTLVYPQLRATIGGQRPSTFMSTPATASPGGSVSTTPTTSSTTCFLQPSPSPC